MKHTSIRKAILGVAAGLALCAGAVPKHAMAQQEWALQGVTFDDGTTATGVISLNVYEYLSAPLTVTTVNGAISGYTYSLPDPTNLTGGDTIVDLSRGAPHYYDGYLHLVFADPLDTAAGVDPLVLGGASYECNGYASYPAGVAVCGGTSRAVTAGMAAAPEPATLAVLGAGLLGLGLIRRRLV